MGLRGTSSSVGGEGGIRPHDTLPYTRFPSVRLRPLGHLSIISGGRLRLPPAPPRAYAGDPRDPSPARFVPRNPLPQRTRPVSGPLRSTQPPPATHETRLRPASSHATSPPPC